MSSVPIGGKEVAKYIRQHHSYVLSRVDEDGRFSYDLYPHHIWSNPLEYNDFSELDKRRITAYVFVSELVCLGDEDIGLTRHVVHRSERSISLKAKTDP